MHDKAFNIAETPKYDEYQRGLAWMVYKLSDKKSLGSVNTSAVRGTVCVTLYMVLSENLATRAKFAVKSKVISNQQLVEVLHKPIIQTFEMCKVFSFFKDNILGADLGDMKLISK